MKEVKILNSEKVVPFDSSMLNVGEMMLSNNINAKGHIILMTHDGLVSLTDPSYTWSSSTRLEGTRLKSGTQILLTA